MSGRAPWLMLVFLVALTTVGACAWESGESLFSDTKSGECRACEFEGRCYEDGEPNPLNTCLACKVSDDEGHWDQNLDPTWLRLCTACEGCLYGNECFDVGETHPERPCMVCGGPDSDIGWVAVEDQTDCDDGLLCNGIDWCQDGTCRHENPAFQDSLWCNGQEACDDLLGEYSTGDPCQGVNVECDESEDECILSDEYYCFLARRDHPQPCQLSANCRYVQLHVDVDNSPVIEGLAHYEFDDATTDLMHGYHFRDDRWVLFDRSRLGYSYGLSIMNSAILDIASFPAQQYLFDVITGEPKDDTVEWFLDLIPIESCLNWPEPMPDNKSGAVAPPSDEEPRLPTAAEVDAADDKIGADSFVCMNASSGIEKTRLAIFNIPETGILYGVEFLPGSTEKPWHVGGATEFVADEDSRAGWWKNGKWALYARYWQEGAEFAFGFYLSDGEGKVTFMPYDFDGLPAFVAPIDVKLTDCF
ncbi:MAG: hypothetical protein H6683_07350 [Deltaproteobacteria bacterium]|nr:hypothetical protein [Deltaproteobacteria bacterium]